MTNKLFILSALLILCAALFGAANRQPSAAESQPAALSTEMRTEIAEFAAETARREIRIILLLIVLLAVYPFYHEALRRYFPKYVPRLW